MNKSKVLPYLALLGCVLALSLSSLFIRLAEASPLVTTFYRMAIAALVFTPFGIHTLKNQPRLKPVHLLFPILAGGLSAFDHATWGFSIMLTRVANATLLNNIAPLWVALVAWFFWKRRPSSRFWIGLLFTLAGATVVLGYDMLMHPTLTFGDLLAVLSSFFYAGYYLVTERGRMVLPAITYVWLATASTAMVLLAANLVSGQSLAGYPLNTYLVFLAAGLISQVGGYFSIVYALGHLSAAVVSPTMIAQPVLTALLAIPVLGEALFPGQFIGGMVVLLGIFLVNTSPPQVHDKEKG